MKRSSSDAEICPSENSFKSSRSLDVASAEAMRILLELVDISSHANAFRRAIVGVPLVGWRPHEKQVLLDIENEVLQWRGKLLQASEAVAECGEKYLESVDYKALDALALAAQQRRIIQNHLFSNAIAWGLVNCNEHLRPAKSFEQRRSLSQVFGDTPTIGGDAGGFERHGDEGMQRDCDRLETVGAWKFSCGVAMPQETGQEKANARSRNGYI